MNCPVCGESRQDYLFVKFGLKFHQCSGCGLIRAEDAGRGNGTFAYSHENASAASDAPGSQQGRDETEALQKYLRFLNLRGLEEKGRVLILSDSGGDSLIAEDIQKKSITVIKSWKDLNELRTREKFDAAIIDYQLEKTTRPQSALKKIYSFLKPEALFLVALPSLDSRQARMFGSAWIGWRPENKVYFSETTIQLLLWKSHFFELEIIEDERHYTMVNLNQRANSSPQTWVTKGVQAAYRLWPAPFREWKLVLPSSGMVVVGRKMTPVRKPICSFIVPAYNESRTFPVLLKSLLEKELPANAQKEIVIIESNSTDGTREQVSKLEGIKGIKVIYQSTPRGKGNAVREGLTHASGDIVIIQDADLEYDLNDLDELLLPLLNYRAPFVLGSRHGGQWKMRHFTDERGMSAFFNFGHQLFTRMLNLIYGQKLKDPFTMYKVFYRDCLYGLLLEANRFDFDFELVIKLIRKGYRPVEIPINYRSRSFKEGKKVRVFRDPMTWIWALVKYRFAPIKLTKGINKKRG